MVVAGAFTIMFFTFGLAYSYAPFIASLQDEFSASRGAVSTAFSIAVPLYFALGAVSGPLADRYGPGRIGILGVAIGGIGILAAARAEALWEVNLGFGIGVGIAIGFSYVPAIGAVQGWFSRRRGTASGIAVSGIGLGTLCMPLVAAHLIDALGWRTAWTVLGLSMVGAGGFALMFVRKAPPAVAVPGGNSSTLLEGVSLRQSVRSRRFVLLYMSMSFVSIGAFIPFVHLVPYAEDQGFSHDVAVWIFSMLGLGSTFGRFIGGGVADRLGRRKALAAVFATLAVMLLWWMSSSSSWQLYLFAFVFGAAYGGFVALFPALCVDYFGTRNSIGIIGVLYTAMSIGTLLGPKLAGDAFDIFGDYDLPIAISAAFALAAAGIVALMPEPGAATLPGKA
ncbi:MAG TPA: MFS transporter [Kaistia sp.]|jgi:MFS family permease|nr:MFS transporter [Kaistia sp.]